MHRISRHGVLLLVLALSTLGAAGCKRVGKNGVVGMSQGSSNVMSDTTSPSGTPGQSEAARAASAAEASAPGASQPVPTPTTPQRTTPSGQGNP